MSDELDETQEAPYVAPSVEVPEPQPKQQLLPVPQRSYKITTMGLTGWEIKHSILETIRKISDFAHKIIQKILPTSSNSTVKKNKPGLLPNPSTLSLKDIVIPGKSAPGLQASTMQVDPSHPTITPPKLAPNTTLSVETLHVGDSPEKHSPNFEIDR